MENPWDSGCDPLRDNKSDNLVFLSKLPIRREQLTQTEIRVTADSNLLGFLLLAVLLLHKRLLSRIEIHLCVNHGNIHGIRHTNQLSVQG